MSASGFFPGAARCAGILACAALVFFGSPASAQLQSIGGLDFDPASGSFSAPAPPEGGWQALAQTLQKASPSTNTALALSPAQINAHIARLLDAGQAAQALELIDQSAAVRAKTGAMGHDVQLQYQRARALSALGQRDQAIAVLQHMTTEFPELPEPWNALGIEYLAQGQPERARQALDMALLSDPDFPAALENLGRVQMLLAEQNLARARALQSSQP